jgi:hypothetical protein
MVRLGASANGEDAGIVGGCEDGWGAPYIVDFVSSALVVGGGVLGR